MVKVIFSEACSLAELVFIYPLSDPTAEKVDILSVINAAIAENTSQRGCGMIRNR